MDEKQLDYEFQSILSESHPGLTFEEYRDSCVFLMFYQYLCLKYEDQIDECYQLSAMVRMAMRGKLQMNSFLKFIENAAPFFYMSCREFRLDEFSFYHKLLHTHAQEKQKSYARFFRKLIKKIDAWEPKELVLKRYPYCFRHLIFEFASTKKETFIPKSILQLYRDFSGSSKKENIHVFEPSFRYGLVLQALLKDCQSSRISGYEEKQEYMEIVSILCYMNDIPSTQLCLTNKEDWILQQKVISTVDTVGIYLPEGVEPGTLLSKEDYFKENMEFIRLRSKGEFPMLLSALPLLTDEGNIVAVLPSALLYREGKEGQIRKYLTETIQLLDTVILLPDNIFSSVGQSEVFLYLQKNRKHKDIMFFDCSEMAEFGEKEVADIREAWEKRTTIPGYCSCVDVKALEENDYNLNLPRYIKKPIGIDAIDIEERRKRIHEIDLELLEIEKRIAMYRRDLELDFLVKD